MNSDTTTPYAFKYEVPEGDKPRSIAWLCRTDKLLADVQVLRGGGETHLHAHPHLDGFWFVLKGRARFHGENDLIGDVGPNEGVLLPRGTKYWFEAVGPEPLQVLQIEVPDNPMKSMGRGAGRSCGLWRSKERRHAVPGGAAYQGLAAIP